MTQRQEGNRSPETDDSSEVPTVLVVDDEPDALWAMVQSVMAAGYRVCSASCAGAALELIRRNSDIEILYTDVLMPRMDGVTLARRALELNPNIRVLLVSGSPDAVADLHGGEPGEFAFLMKPVSPSEVAYALGR